jgi:hypothetical protein
VIKYFYEKIGFIAGFILVAILALSFTVLAAETGAENAKHAKRVAIISFQPLTPEEESGRTVFCPICSIGASGGKIIKGSEKIVEEIFVDKLHQLKEVQLIPTDKVEAVYKRISSESLKEPLLKSLMRTGDELGADFVAVGYVYRYVERVGYKYSTERPASVVFEIHLIKTSDGSIVWRGFFDKTQKSLMEDVFQMPSFLKGGAKWLTARQLTEQGMNKIFETFPKFEN